MLKGGLVLIWELDINLVPILVFMCMNIFKSPKNTKSAVFFQEIDNFFKTEI